MGIRIQTAIGWGMPVDRFLSAIRAPGVPTVMTDGWFDEVEAVLQHTRGMRGPMGLPLPVTGPTDTVLDLMRFIGYDEYSDVIMAPSIDEARRWFRRGDDIDYAFHVGTRGPSDHEVPGTRIEYMPYGFHPYDNLRMNEDGSVADPPASDDYHAAFEWPRRTDLLPGVPPMLRHWLTVSGMLEQSGIAELRPLRAIWWS